MECNALSEKGGHFFLYGLQDGLSVFELASLSRFRYRAAPQKPASQEE